MAKDWGLKITKPGEATSTNDPTKMLFSSKYQMFKYHNEYSITSVFSPGDTTHTVSITHGLNYVPAFFPYVYRSDNLQLFIVPGVDSFINRDIETVAWADTTKIYFKTTFGRSSGNGWNVKKYIVSDLWSTWFDTNVSYALGRHDGNTETDAAFRFGSVAITSGDSLNNAILGIFVGTAANTPGGRIKWDTFGMDEDNTASFGSSPMGRSRTSASTFRNIDAQAEGNTGNTPETNVTSQVNEIRARGGWSSGNAMGFIFDEAGGDPDNYMYNSNHESWLRLTFNGNLTFTYKVLVFKDQIAT